MVRPRDIEVDLFENFQLVYSDLNIFLILTHLIIIQGVLQDRDEPGAKESIKSPHHPPRWNKEGDNT